MPGLTPRSFLTLVVFDHQFTMTKAPSPGNAQGLDHIANLTCSCGWSTGRAVSLREMAASYNTTLTSEWSDRSQLQHLLDQELDLRSVLLKITEQMR